MPLITSGQIRMGRALMRWSHEDLAKASGVGASTIKRMETFNGIPRSRVDNIQAVHDAFVATGKIRFEGETAVFIESED